MYESNAVQESIGWQASRLQTRPKWNTGLRSGSDRNIKMWRVLQECHYAHQKIHNTVICIIIMWTVISTIIASKDLYRKMQFLQPVQDWNFFRTFERWTNEFKNFLKFTKKLPQYVIYLRPSLLLPADHPDNDFHKSAFLIIEVTTNHWKIDLSNFYILNAALRIARLKWSSCKSEYSPGWNAFKFFLLSLHPEGALCINLE